MQPYGSTSAFHASPSNYYASEDADDFDSSFTDSMSGKQPSPFMTGERRRINLVPIVLSLVVPWVFFVIIFAMVSFSLHYKQPWLCLMGVAAALLLVLILGCFALDSTKKKMRNSPNRQPTWLIFLFLTCLLASVSAIVAGDYNYYQSSKPFYDIEGLETYVSVDPALKQGEQIMDGGRVIFTPDSRLDMYKAMGFHNVDTYCVVPITSVPRSNGTTLETYDFWAVGVNCCVAKLAGVPDFHCGQFANQKANGGLRLMNDFQRPFFRLAVQQAEAAYNIRASHPLFYEWVQDPIAESGKFKEEGLRFFMMGVFTYFVVQLFIVLSTTIAFSRLGKI